MIEWMNDLGLQILEKYSSSRKRRNCQLARRRRQSRNDWGRDIAKARPTLLSRKIDQFSAAQKKKGGRPNLEYIGGALLTFTQGTLQVPRNHGLRVVRQAASSGHIIKYLKHTPSCALDQIEEWSWYETANEASPALTALFLIRLLIFTPLEPRSCSF
jgi:hypothetical protein